MFGRKKKSIQQKSYDQENWYPVLHCSICNGEQVAGFKNIHTKEFKEEMFIRTPQELDEFRKMYGITGEITKEY